MSPFVVERRTPLPVAEAWRRLTDWERHTATVPLTRISVLTPPPDGVGTAFVARTGLGGAGFDDPMRIVRWEPPVDGGPGFCRLEKTGRIVTGWAEIDVRPDDSGTGAGADTGSWVRWREELRVWRLPGAFDAVTARTGRLVFGRAVDTLLRGE
ncbi:MULTISPECIES: SRPBCC family protein [unclassified Streptomyces]|uniref:SRPBCC family protein n=1 Tax=unclassified Streptomyces TaxID=2593676 RepID=UPI0033A32459